MGVKASDDVRKLHERLESLFIGVISSDFSFIHDIIELARSRNIHLHVMDPEDDEDIHLDCIILEREGKRPLNTRTDYFIERFPDAERSLERAIFACFNRLRPEILAIGIDPGKRPGIAFIADGRLVSIFRSSSDRGVASRIKLMVESSDPGEVNIRMGDGAPQSRANISSLLEEMELDVEIVDERKTTLSKKYRDEVAAIIIGRTKTSKE